MRPHMCFLITAILWMLNVSFWGKFWSYWQQPKRFPATFPTDGRISCGNNVSVSQCHPWGQTWNRKTSRLAKQPAVLNDSPCSLPPDMSFFSSCCYSTATHTFAYFVTRLDISKQVQVFLIIGRLQWSCILMAHNIKDNLITLWLLCKACMDILRIQLSTSTYGFVRCLCGVLTYLTMQRSAPSMHCTVMLIKNGDIKIKSQPDSDLCNGDTLSLFFFFDPTS